MTDIRTQMIGNNADAPFVAFGDDSQYKGILTFAYVFVPRNRMRRVVRDIQKIKDKFNFPTNTLIHCRVLFSGQQRAKQGLAHLSQQEVQSIMHHAITVINQHQIFLRYAFARTENISNMFEDGTITLEHESDGTSVNLSASLAPKGIIGLLAQACFASNPNGSQGPTASQCEIFAAQDATKIQFIGNNRQRADSLIQGYSDIGAPSETVFHIKSTIAGNEFSPIFELADIATYLCSHAMHGKEKEPFFSEALARVKYWARSEFLSNPPPIG